MTSNAFWQSISPNNQPHTMSPHPHGHSEYERIAARLPAFDFEGLIGRGATGSVYKARQRSLDRDVAIRTICGEKCGDPAFRTSFRERARSMARLTHPSLIRIFDSGEMDGLPFLVMEYVPGKSLHHSAHGKAIDAKQAVEIAIAACEGLAHAHANGIAHGAIQPADILLTPKCEPKIGNFGGVDHAPANAAAYMAPELASGASPASPLSDVHAIGVILRELLTGVPAGSANAAQAGISDARLAAICQQAAHADPARRFPDATSLAAALKSWLRPTGFLVAPGKPQLSPQRPRPVLVTGPAPRSGRMLLRNGAVITALLLAIHGAWGVYQERQHTVARLQKTEDAKAPVVIVKRSARPAQAPIEPMIAQADR
jgi:serine/threonine protein kinase